MCNRRLFFGTVFYEDDIVLFGASVCEVQKIINLCCDMGKNMEYVLIRRKLNGYVRMYIISIYMLIFC